MDVQFGVLEQQKVVFQIETFRKSGPLSLVEIFEFVRENDSNAARPQAFFVGKERVIKRKSRSF